MQIVTKAKSFATYNNAVKKLKHLLGDELDQVRWFVIAQSDGRFTPAVAVGGASVGLAFLAHEGVAVIG